LSPSYFAFNSSSNLQIQIFKYRLQYTEHPSPCTYIPLLLRMGRSCRICIENVDTGYGALCLTNMPLTFIILGWVFKFYCMVYEKCIIWTGKDKITK
jgi:hypothetical protein